MISVLRREVLSMAFERDKKYCPIEKKETIFIRTDRGVWLCSCCHYVSSYIDRDELEGGDKENE